MQEDIEEKAKEIWNTSSFKKEISFDIFLMAMQGYSQNTSFKTGILTIIDYSKPSTQKRFYVIDLNAKKLLFHTLVSHGQKTGYNKASNFSNESESHKSSLGFFKTAETYSGKHGYSLRLDGLEKGINNNARSRAIVIHEADYVSQKFIQKHGRLGRSWGCPALPVGVSKKIIDTISRGTCLFVFGKSKDYKTKSKYFK
jgi:hypothetical protein